MSQIERSAELVEFQAAFLAAQAEMNNPTFDKLNPHFKSNYASLKSVREAVLPVLLKNGITVVQYLTNNEKGDMCCITELMHKSGQFKSAALSIPADRLTGQGYASAATYARRIGLQAMCCVVGDTDLDGNEGEKAKGKRTSVAGGIMDELDIDIQKKLVEMSGPVKDLIAKGNIDAAVDKLESYEYDDENQTVAIWSLFASSERSAMKKVMAKRKEGK